MAHIEIAIAPVDQIASLLRVFTSQPSENGMFIESDAVTQEELETLFVNFVPDPDFGLSAQKKRTRALATKVRAGNPLTAAERNEVLDLIVLLLDRSNL